MSVTPAWLDTTVRVGVKLPMTWNVLLVTGAPLNQGVQDRAIAAFIRIRQSKVNARLVQLASSVPPISLLCLRLCAQLGSIALLKLLTATITLVHLDITTT